MICTVYSPDGTPVSRVSSERALVLMLLDKVHMISQYEDKQFRSVRESFPVPKEVVVRDYISLPKDFYTAVPLNPRTLKLRDKNTCMYCGRHASDLKKKEFMTVDHIMPRSRGGKNRWDNVVLSCNKCNNDKDDRTPGEAGLTLMTQPRQPTRWELV